jgi:plasmid rolling circle replication initiator protein Rep
MSALPYLDTMSINRGSLMPPVAEGMPLSEYSERDASWDYHKAEALEVAAMYATSKAHALRAERMRLCARHLEFVETVDKQTGAVSTKLHHAMFCHNRYCPICAWRRSLFWKAKFHKALPEIMEQYPKSRFIFLTLTVRNMPVNKLRKSLQSMNKAWSRLVKRVQFNAVQGWVRSTEVTRDKNGDCHPHFHVMLMVDGSYFSENYVKHSEWVRAWREVMRIDYDPIVNVKAIKAKNSKSVDLSDAIAETLKYSVKVADLRSSDDWLIEMTEQTSRLRFIATGGVFKDILKSPEEITDEDMIHTDDETETAQDIKRILIFKWSDYSNQYTLRDIHKPLKGIDSPPRGRVRRIPHGATP